MKYLTLILLPFLLSSCFAQKQSVKEWNNLFTKSGVEGTFVLYNQKTKQYKYYNRSRSNKRYLPASTYKILNSLIALETKVIKNENEIIKWDNIDKGWSKWNQDHDLKSAISVSCVWFYQELARRIGKERMQNWISEIQYGNQLMGADIDNFWLQGDIKISVIEQVKLIDRLIKNELPFQLENQEIVKRIMITDSTKDYTIHSKTGWGSRVKPQIGWYVGYIEKDNNNWIFALNIDIKNKSDLKYRKSLVYEILREEKLISF